MCVDPFKVMRCRGVVQRNEVTPFSFSHSCFYVLCSLICLQNVHLSTHAFISNVFYIATVLHFLSCFHLSILFVSFLKHTEWPFCGWNGLYKINCTWLGSNIWPFKRNKQRKYLLDRWEKPVVPWSQSRSLGRTVVCLGLDGVNRWNIVKWVKPQLFMVQQL